MQCGDFLCKSGLSHWGSSRVDLEFSLGRAQKMTEMHPEGISALLRSAQVRKGFLLNNYSVPLQQYFHLMAEAVSSRPKPQVDLWSSSQLLQQGGSLNCIGKISVCWSRLGWHLHWTVSHRLLKKLLRLPLFNYVAICVYNVHIEFIFLWINFHTCIRKLLSEYQTQPWDFILMPFSQFYELRCKSGGKEMNYSLPSNYLLHRSLCLILNQ